jgi:hypothetical protein
VFFNVLSALLFVGVCAIMTKHYFGHLIETIEKRDNVSKQEHFVCEREGEKFRNFSLEKRQMVLSIAFIQSTQLNEKPFEI